LGNLVTVDGKLIAANPAGVCAYFSYEEVRQRMAKKISDAATADKPAIMLNSGQLALNSRQFGDAIGDMQAALDLAKKQGNEAMTSKISAALCKAYTNAGNAAQTPQEMVEHFNKAIGFTGSEAEKSLMKLRLAKAYEQAGMFTQAVAAGQELIEKYGSADMADIDIGLKAIDMRPDDVKDKPLYKGGTLGKLYIDRFIRKGGRVCYKTYDTQADEALKSATAKGDLDALCNIEKTWPNANCLNEAFFLAAELAYKAAQGKPAEQAQPLQSQAIRLLERVANSSGPRSVSAAVAVAMIYGRGNTAGYAASLVEALRDLPPNTDVAFADIRGKLGDMLAKIDGGNVPKLPAELRNDSFVDLPASELVTMNAVSTVLLKDHNLRPIRIGDSLAAIQGKYAILIDTMADNDRNAVRWTGIVGLTQDDTTQNNQQKVPNLVGSLSDDGKYLYVANDETITALEVATAKIKWQKNLAEFDMADPLIMSIGGNRLITVSANGRVNCLNLETGEFAWRAQMPADKGANPGQPRFSSLGVPQIGGGVVAIAHNTRTLTCYGLSNGKMLAKWDSTNGNIDFMFNPAGQLLTVVNNELACREPAQLNKPTWTRNYQGKNPGLLAIDGDRVAVAPNRGGSEIEILSMQAEGKLIAKFTTAGGGASMPVEGRFEGDNFYVVELNSYVMPRRVSFMYQNSVVQSARIEKFQIGSKAGSLWSASIPCDSNGVVAPAMEVGTNQVAVSCLPVRQNGDGFAYMLDASNGKILDKFPLGKMKLQNKPNYVARLRLYGAPVMTNGRMCLETLEGVSIYGK
ncbi:MAG: hypothetical protein EHM48_04400, partial [Planctomycetaceae bacterium]